MSKVELENENHSEENEDEPEPYATSEEEWKEEKPEKKRGGRRVSQRLSKKPRVVHKLSESDEEAEDDPSPSDNTKNGNTVRSPKLKVAKLEKAKNSPQTDRQSIRSRPVPLSGSKTSADFVNGGFLILRKDTSLGDSTKQPCIWRIDGKALLQKYESSEENGKVLHRNTSVYTGWSPMDKDYYYPVTVKVLQHQGQNMTVELNWEKLRELIDESED